MGTRLSSRYIINEKIYLLETYSKYRLRKKYTLLHFIYIKEALLEGLRIYGAVSILNYRIINTNYISLLNMCKEIETALEYFMP